MEKRKKFRLLYVMLVLFIAVFLLLSKYFMHLYNINNAYTIAMRKNETVSLRRFPYPYKAGLAISSDIDNTEDIDELITVMRFLDTDEATPLGNGLGMEIGNSFLMWESPEGTISFFNNDEMTKKVVIKLIHSGYLDFLHSYGKKKDFTRNDAIHALVELKKNDLKIDTWVDHTTTIDNLGNEVTKGEGDIIGSHAYHADITLKYGIKFVWLGRVTNFMGQATPISLEKLTLNYDKEHPVRSMANIVKEVLKNFLGVMGYKKYEMHAINDLTKVTTLDDGSKVFEFIRYDNSWRGVGNGANSAGLAYSISKQKIDGLIKDEGYSIVYTHFGKNNGSRKYLPEETIKSLRYLSKQYHSGNIYVTTTSKLLNYYVNRRYLIWKYEKNGDNTDIKIQYIDDPVFGKTVPSEKQLQGITFYVDEPESTRVFIDGRIIDGVVNNDADFTGQKSISLPISNLKFPY